MKNTFFISVIFIIITATAFSWGRQEKTARSIGPIVTSSSPSPVALAVPKELAIPALDITTPIEPVTEDAQGNMDVPKDPWHVAWYQKGYLPGQQGNAVLAGHLDSPGGPAIFYKLGNLSRGDDIFLTDTTGKKTHFRVVTSHLYPYASFPLTTVFGSQGKAQLNLITCAGTFEKKEKLYSQRLVVTAQLVP